MKCSRAPLMSLFAFLAASVSHVSTVLAADENTPVTRIAVPVQADFEPTGASCFLRGTEGARLVRGLFVPEDTAGRARADGGRTWIICCNVPGGIIPDGEVSVLIEREGSPALVRSIPAESIYEAETELGTEEKARQYLAKQRGILASYQVQLKAQQQSLSRLRSDADLIGEQGSLSARERQLATDEEQLSAFRREKQNLEESVKQIRLQQAPLNGATIEVEITKQIAELAQAARLAESGERAREVEGEGDLGGKLRLIEETRFDDPEQIRAELIKMRRRRQELEESLQGSVGSPADYE